MKTFYLHGDMADRFCESINLNVTTIREFFESLSSNFPAFKKFLINKTLNGVQYVFVDENKDSLECYYYDVPLPAKNYHVMPAIEGAAMGAGLFAANAIQGYAMGHLVNKIGSIMEDDGSPEYEKITTNSFIYKNNENTVEQGSSIPVVYGQLRIGSKIINSTITNYDYLYDDAELYPHNPQYSKLIHSKNIQDFRQEYTSEIFELLKGTESDSSKRTSFTTKEGKKTVFDSNSSKPFDDSAQNASSHYQQGGQNVQTKIVGPTENPARPAQAKVGGWWDHADNDTPNRPTLWGHGIDENMRPQSEQDVCVETIFPSDKIKTHSWESSSTPLKVGRRGSFNKLESIAFYNTVEVLSEGPIVGLSTSITGFDRDSGIGLYPFIESDESVDVAAAGQKKIAVQSLTFSSELQKLTSQTSNSQLTILSAGRDYPDFDGIITAGDANATIPISIDKPTTLFSANIDSTSFYGGANSEPIMTSSNEIFSLQKSNGEISLNESFPSAEQTIQEETFTYDGQQTTKDVISLKLLEANNDLGASFNMGEGYDPEDKEFIITPDNSKAELEIEYVNSKTSSRLSQASIFDAAVISDTPGSIQSRAYVEEVLSDSAESKLLDTYEWSAIPRIYYDGSELDETNLPDNITHDTYLYVAIGTITLTQEKYSSYWGWQINATRTLTLHLRLSIANYVGLGTWSRNDIGHLNGSTFYNYYNSLQQTATIKSLGGFSENFNNNYQYKSSWARDTAIKDDDNWLYRQNFTKQSDVNYFDSDNFNRYVEGTTSSSVSIGPYINASKALSLRFKNAIESKIPNIRMSTFNDRHFIKFGIGTGANVKPRQMFKQTDLPAYMVQAEQDGGERNLDHVVFKNKGNIIYNFDNEEIEDDRGFYSPFIYPRVSVFIIRSNKGSDTVSIVPTNIEAVAEINAKGLTEKIHLLRVPDHPVYDATQAKWTPIHPLRQYVFGAYSGYYNSNTDKEIQTNSQPRDLGILCVIDSSNEATNLSLTFQAGSLNFRSLTTSVNHNIQESFDEHIINNQPTYTRLSAATGLFPEFVGSSADMNDSTKSFVKVIDLDFDSVGYNNSENDNSKALITIESLNLSDSSKNYKKSSIFNHVSQSNCSFIHTGRPKEVNIQEGSGYINKDGTPVTGAVTAKIYPKYQTIESIKITDSGLGYKPDSDFFIFGMATMHQVSSLGYAYFSMKARVTIDQRGKIKDITVVDGGFGFKGMDSTTTINHLLFSDSSRVTSSRSSALSFGFLGEEDKSQYLTPEIHFPKQDLKIRVAREFLAQPNLYGKLSKFYIEQTGLGFVYNQEIDNFFDEPIASDIQFQLRTAGGSLQSISILGDSHPGYTELDTNVRLRFASPDFVETEIIIPDADPHGWAYAIYLNDTPIRDRSNYFNFSKFHFDMRAGHYNNGLKDTMVSEANLRTEAKASLLSSEFRMPSNTTIISYPLYGPRNNGEMDYYYTHTIKNPNVSGVVISINIQQLHYIYEGDESNLYINLSPIIIIACLYFAIKSALAALADVAVGSTTEGTIVAPAIVASAGLTYIPCSASGTTFPTTATGGVVVSADLGPAAAAVVLTALEAALAAFIVGFIIDEIGGATLKCSQVPFLCFKVGEIVKNSGEIWPAKVYINIEYGLEGEALTQETIAFRGCATNEYIKDIPIDVLPSPNTSNSNNQKNRILKVYRATREPDPVRQGIVEARYKIKTSLHSITEYVDHSLSFPNTALIGTRFNSKDHPSIPRREYVVKGKLIQIPSNYQANVGTYNGDWDGSFQASPAWTSNPAWVIYDLLTNKIYGMGKHGIESNQIDKWSFYRFAKYCDEKVDTVIDGIKNGSNPYQERRYMCNLYVDTEQEAYQYIQKLLSLYSASLNFSGNQLYITYDKQVNDDEIIMGFTNSNIHEDGFSYASTPITSRITAVTVDYLDERDNYMRKSEYVEDTQYIAEHGYSHIKIPGISITRKGEAHRLAWQKILTQQLEREIINFKAGLQASYLRIGDVIDIIDRNKMSNHHGGNVLKVHDSRTIEIDLPTSAITEINEINLSFANNEYPQWTNSTSYFVGDKVYDTKNFALYIKTTDDSSSINPSDDLDNWSLFESGSVKQYESYQISSSSGFLITLSSDIDEHIKPGSNWWAASSSSEAPNAKPYRIQSIKEIESMTFEISATEYVNEKYTYVNLSSGDELVSNLSSTIEVKGPDGNNISF